MPLTLYNVTALVINTIKIALDLYYHVRVRILIKVKFKALKEADVGCYELSNKKLVFK